MVTYLNKWLGFSLVPVIILMGDILQPIPSPNEKVSHPFHVSTTEINHNDRDKSLEISCRIFIDDFEDALEKQFKTPADLSKEAMKTQMDSLVKRYILNHLQVKPDNRQLALDYIGFEKESDAVWVYLQGNNIATVKKIEINNSILYDIFEDQISIMHVKVGGVRKSTKLDYPDRMATFNF